MSLRLLEKKDSIVIRNESPGVMRFKKSPYDRSKEEEGRSSQLQSFTNFKIKIEKVDTKSGRNTLPTLETHRSATDKIEATADTSTNLV